MCVLIAAVVACFAAPVNAAVLVTFEDGRSLRAATLDYDDGIATIRLEDGGSLGVPVESIARLDPASPRPAPTAEELEPERVVRLASSLSGEGWRSGAGRYADLLADAADRHGVDRALFAAVAKIESNFDPFAVSAVGACGILQLMPSTARRFGVRNLFDPKQNADGGARYLRWLLDRFDGDLSLALAGYNAGEGAVDRYHGVPPYAETKAYVARILGRIETQQAP